MTLEIAIVLVYKKFGGEPGPPPQSRRGREGAISRMSIALEHRALSCCLTEPVLLEASLLNRNLKKNSRKTICYHAPLHLISIGTIRPITGF